MLASDLGFEAPLFNMDFMALERVEGSVLFQKQPPHPTIC
jgi:hypothetical protein